MNLMQLFDSQADSFPYRPAISVSHDSMTWNYQTLAQKSQNLAHAFYHQGIRKGDGVLILIPMSLELYATLLALFRLGAVAVFIDPQNSRQQIEKCIKRYPLKAFIGVPKAHLLRFMVKGIRAIKLKVATGFFPFTQHLEKMLDNAYSPAPVCDIQPEDGALITFTSGSTGEPKAALRTHAFLLKQYEILSANMFFQEGQTDLSTLPVFVLANLAAGMHSVIPDVNIMKPAEVDGKKLLADIIRYRAQRFGGSPVLVSKITPFIDEDNQNILLSHVYLGGGPVYPKTLHELQDKLHHTEIVALYGSTEAEPIADAFSYDYNEVRTDLTQQGAGLFSGVPISQIKVKIVASEKLNEGNSNFSSLILPVYEVGEILVTGEHVLKGYLDGIGDKENKILYHNEIWHRTGDAGYFDDQGQLWLLGRYSSRIVYKEQILYPFAIEAALYQQDINSALIEYGNEPVLVIEQSCQPLFKQSMIEKWNIQNVIFIDSIPRDKRHNAKVDYPALLKRLKKQ
jgi:acyl-CoA synthetase (AMP-forming)/AMP-acid ligase II